MQKLTNYKRFFLHSNLSYQKNKTKAIKVENLIYLLKSIKQQR